MTTGIVLTGRWLHYGIEHHEQGLAQGIYSAVEWDKACAQAKAWGMTGVTPKVADGGNKWYDDNGLMMLFDTAKRHGLQIAPYHYVYGNKFGALQQEAAICAWIGHHFGVVIPDMEAEWFGHGDWMQEFGFSVNHSYGYTGPIIPTTFANPSVQNAFPYVQMNVWASAWIPQVYFDEWTFSGHRATAKDGIDYVYPQWQALDKLCRLHGNGPLKPILPLIGLTKGVPAQEIANWLVDMHGYGYCGFWYDGVYAPYAETVLHAPMPALPAPEPKVPPPPTTSTIKVPTGWHFDGKFLSGPKGEGPLEGLFADYVLARVSTWDPGNVPMGPQVHQPSLEISNTKLGPGFQVIFLKGTMLCIPESPEDVGLKGHVIEEFSGRELMQLRILVGQLQNQLAELEKTKDAQYLTVIETLEKDLTQAEQITEELARWIASMLALSTTTLTSVTPSPSSTSASTEVPPVLVEGGQR